MRDFGIEWRMSDDIIESIRHLALILNTPEKVDYALYHLSLNILPKKCKNYSEEVVDEAIRKFYFSIPNLFSYVTSYKTESDDIQMQVDWINGALENLIRPLGDCQSSKLLYLAIKFNIWEYDDYDGYSEIERETLRLFDCNFENLMDFIRDFINEYGQKAKEAK